LPTNLKLEADKLPNETLNFECKIAPDNSSCSEWCCLTLKGSRPPEKRKISLKPYLFRKKSGSFQIDEKTYVFNDIWALKKFQFLKYH